MTLSSYPRSRPPPEEIAQTKAEGREYGWLRAVAGLAIAAGRHLCVRTTGLSGVRCRRTIHKNFLRGPHG